MSASIPSFAGMRALVTGGAGFIGSNLAIALVKSGATVRVVDAMISGYGGNLFNLESVNGRVAVDGWRPRTPLSEGLTRTLAYYREHKSRYWP